MKKNESNHFKIISTGKLTSSLNRAQVVQRLGQRFSLDESQANKMCAQGFCIKKLDNQDDAEKAVRLFSSLGLGVTIQAPRAQEQKEQVEFQTLDLEALRWSRTDKWSFIAVLVSVFCSQLILVLLGVLSLVRCITDACVLWCRISIKRLF